MNTVFVINIYLFIAETHSRKYRRFNDMMNIETRNKKI